MKELWGADKFAAELEAAKDDLRGLEKNIRKILGRDVPESENGTAPVAVRPAQKRPQQEDRRRQNPDFPNNEFGAKRRWQGNNNAEPKTVFSRLSTRVPSTADDSGDEDDGSVKPAVSSRVTVTPREVPSRQEVIRRESTDERSRQRNKRMFGALLGTLQKFRQEETKLKAKEDKKAEVEARVEEAKRKEREELRKERQQLFTTRKQRQAQVKVLEAKLARSKQYQEWREAQIPLLNFIKSKAQPHIYYLPKKSTPETEVLLFESTKGLKAEIDKRERILIKELEVIESQFGMSQLNKSHLSSESHENSIIEPEEEENRDPNPEKNGDIEMTDAHNEIINQSSNFEVKEENNKQGEEKRKESPMNEDSDVEKNDKYSVKVEDEISNLDKSEKISETVESDVENNEKNSDKIDSGVIKGEKNSMQAMEELDSSMHEEIDTKFEKSEKSDNSEKSDEDDD